MNQKLTELGRKEIVYIVIWTLYNEKCSGFLKHSGSNIYEDPMAVCKVRIFEAILFCLSRYFNQNFFHFFFLHILYTLMNFIKIKSFAWVLRLSSKKLGYYYIGEASRVICSILPDKCNPFFIFIFIGGTGSELWWSCIF